MSDPLLLCDSPFKMHQISLLDINKAYKSGFFRRKTDALSQVSFHVNRGEIFGLIGPNGAGKSTTIRLLLGLSRPDSGRILFDGAHPPSPALMSRIGYLPENSYLYEHSTLAEWLDLGGQVAGMSAAKRVERIDYLLSRLRLGSFRKQRLRSFSKGMRQRAGICFALLHDPEIVILDEPMSGLDPPGRKLLFDLVLDLKKNGKTIFFCSHILSDVERLCDRIGLLFGGRLLRIFESNEFREDPSRPIHLRTRRLAPEETSLFRNLPVTMDESGEGCLLSFPSDIHAEVARVLEQGRLPLWGSCSTRFSLEGLFFETLKEASA